MESIIFLVQGSETDPYQVAFTKQAARLTVSYTCQAANSRLSRKHRLRILDGEKKDIVSNNIDAIPTVLKWLKGSEIERALGVVSEAESKHEQAKKELERAKKGLAKVMILEE